MKRSLVITSIASPNDALRRFADGASENEIHFWVIGDSASPDHFDLPGASFVSLKEQLELDFELPTLCPTRHYARKNIGYLLALRHGTDVILDTDDDNLPYDFFWQEPSAILDAPFVSAQGWCNVYKYFTSETIWPRGFPLQFIKDHPPEKDSLPRRLTFCPIQQGLADRNPDVDAIYRLAFNLPFDFDSSLTAVVIGGLAWCPFNSQNTTWFREAFPLLYLPSFCSFRMTDIWRSFVAKRICTANDWGIAFHRATVWQDRNEHDLLKDFSDEIPGYLNNDRMACILNSLTLEPGAENIPKNMLLCYESLCGSNLFPRSELDLLHAWLRDISRFI